MNCSLQYLNRTTRDKNSHINFHQHPMYEIVYYLSGRGTTSIEDRKYRYGPGTYTIIRPNTLHDEYRESDTEVIYFGFFYQDESVPIPTGAFQDAEDKTLLEMILNIFREQQEKNSYFTIVINHLLQLLLIGINRRTLHGIRHPSDDKLKYALEYMDQYFTEKINLTELARISGYSYDHFRHFFKQSTGFTPMNYILQLRVHHAKSLLLQPRLSVTDIAYECGFSSLSHFSKTFKKLTGQEPTHFKKQAEYTLDSLDKSMKRIKYRTTVR